MYVFWRYGLLRQVSGFVRQGGFVSAYGTCRILSCWIQGCRRAISEDGWYRRAAARDPEGLTQLAGIEPRPLVR